LPLLIALDALGGHGPWERGEVAAFRWVLLAVVVFTTPWDNLAVKWGIWGFPREKYSFRLSYLPVEEYAFFLLQSVNVMLAIRALFRFHPRWLLRIAVPFSHTTWILIGFSAVAWVVVAAQLFEFRRKAGSRINYALHLAWFLPVIYLQWLLAPRLFLGHGGLLILVTCAFGIYYTLADWVAVKARLWFFDEKQITGGKVGGILPWEEMAFFFLTSLLVAQSYLLLVPGWRR
jgi:lycopene cyclase domain-containing protein